MSTDYHTDLWVSHSSIRDYLNCPRAYFLKYIYKDPKTGNKINIINPSLALGLTVHDVLESISLIKTADRFNQSLVDKFENAWLKVSGELGGFSNMEEENEFKSRGAGMIRRVMDNPGPLLKNAIKLKDPAGFIPHYYLSEEENIILCGKVDWIEHIPQDDSLHLIDFKTGKNDEEPNSLQLFIYCLLVSNLQKRKVKKISYWYLNKDNQPTGLEYPDLEEAHDQILEIARGIRALRQAGIFTCRKNGCFACLPLEQVINGEAKYVRSNAYQDIYVCNRE